MPTLEYGDICFHEVTEKTSSKIRTLIATAQSIFFRSSSSYQTTIHSSIYIGCSKSEITEGQTPHQVVEMDQPGLKINPIINGEKLHVVRCKNTRLANLVGDLALSWALRSDKQYSYFNLIKTALPRFSNEFPHTSLSLLRNSLFQELPKELDFTCSELIISLYHVSANLLNIDIKKYIDISHRASPSEFRKAFDQHAEFGHYDIQVFNLDKPIPL